MNDKWNKKVKCKCGCGSLILKYRKNRMRQFYIKGHQPHAKSRPDMIGNSWGGNQNYFKKNKFSGENHNNWKGGRWLYWRRKVLERDNYTCQKCGYSEKDIMEVDHKIPICGKNRFKEMPNINNLMTLCPNCHRRKTLKDRKICKSRRSQS